jgi:hypothetical protein
MCLTRSLTMCLPHPRTCNTSHIDDLRHYHTRSLGIFVIPPSHLVSPRVAVCVCVCVYVCTLCVCTLCMCVCMYATVCIRRQEYEYTHRAPSSREWDTAAAAHFPVYAIDTVHSLTHSPTLSRSRRNPHHLSPSLPRTLYSPLPRRPPQSIGGTWTCWLSISCLTVCCWSSCSVTIFPT